MRTLGGMLTVARKNRTQTHALTHKQARTHTVHLRLHDNETQKAIELREEKQRIQKRLIDFLLSD